jgi:uncharacterized protein
MRNEAEEIDNGKDKIQLIGIDDPAIANNSIAEKTIAEEAIRNAMQQLEGDSSFKILLSHRPELVHLYSQFDFDLVFSGHAHGGQFRIPFIGGFVAPNQGFFPEYYSGKYSVQNTTMIVNRGLGNSIIPLRVFNRPEIVVVTLKSNNN